MVSVAGILVVYGAGMTIMIISDSTTQAIQLRMINVFAAAFSAFVSFGAGYLFGAAAIEAQRKDK